MVVSPRVTGGGGLGPGGQDCADAVRGAMAAAVSTAAVKLVVMKPLATNGRRTGVVLWARVCRGERVESRKLGMRDRMV